MIVGKLRKSGNSFIVTIPRDEVERLQLREGQTVSVEVRPVEVRPVENRPVFAPDLRDLVEDTLRRHEPGLRYLADR